MMLRLYSLDHSWRKKKPLLTRFFISGEYNVLEGMKYILRELIHKVKSPAVPACVKQCL